MLQVNFKLRRATRRTNQICKVKDVTVAEMQASHLLTRHGLGVSMAVGINRLGPVCGYLSLRRLGAQALNWAPKRYVMTLTS